MSRKTTPIRRERIGIFVDPEVTRALRAVLSLEGGGRMSLFFEQAALKKIRDCGNTGIISQVKQLKKP